MNRTCHDENIAYTQRCMLNKYGVFFTITYDEIFNNEVYFKICYGEDKNKIINMLSLSLKDLKRLEINTWYFPNTFMITPNNEESITKTLNDLQIWLNKVLEYGNGMSLFNKLSDNYRQNTWI